MSDHKFLAGDEVECSFKGCKNDTFIVARVHKCSSCGSQALVVAHLKGDPEREIKGMIIDEINYGLDSGWFRKVL